MTSKSLITGVLVDEDSWSWPRVIWAVPTRRSNRSWRSCMVNVCRIILEVFCWVMVLIRQLCTWISNFWIIYVVPRFFKSVHLFFNLFLSCKIPVWLDKTITWKWTSWSMSRHLVEHICRWDRHFLPASGRLLMLNHRWWPTSLIWSTQWTHWAVCWSLQLFSKLVHVFLLMFIDDVN